MEKKTGEMPPSEEVTDRISWCHVSLPKKKMSIPSAVRTIDSQTLPFTRVHSMPRSCTSCLRYADARGKKQKQNGIKIPWIHEFPKVSLLISLTFPAFFFRLRHGFSPSGGSRRSPARRRRGGPPRAAARRQQC